MAVAPNLLFSVQSIGAELCPTRQLTGSDAGETWRKQQKQEAKKSRGDRSEKRASPLLAQRATCQVKGEETRGPPGMQQLEQSKGDRELRWRGEGQPGVATRASGRKAPGARCSLEAVCWQRRESWAEGEGGETSIHFRVLLLGQVLYTHCLERHRSKPGSYAYDEGIAQKLQSQKLLSLPEVTGHLGVQTLLILF